jgi:hypothetical protein
MHVFNPKTTLKMEHRRHARPSRVSAVRAGDDGKVTLEFSKFTTVGFKSQLPMKTPRES